MHLPQFLKQIDTISSRMSRDQLERLLHEIARTIPEKERGRLLSLLRRAEGHWSVTITMNMMTGITVMPMNLPLMIRMASWMMLERPWS